MANNEHEDGRAARISEALVAAAIKIAEAALAEIPDGDVERRRAIKDRLAKYIATGGRLVTHH